MSAKGRRWVEIGFVVLEPHERTANLPDDTKRVPYYCRLKGFAEGDPRVGDIVEVTTQIGRRVEGTVLRLNPAFGHDFGEPVEDLIEAGLEARARLDALLAAEAKGHGNGGGAGDARGDAEGRGAAQ